MPIQGVKKWAPVKVPICKVLGELLAAKPR